MVKDFSIHLWLCAFRLGGSSQVSHILVVQYLPYGSTANFLIRAPTISLQKREEMEDNSNIRDIKTIKIGLPSRALKNTGTK